MKPISALVVLMLSGCTSWVGGVYDRATSRIHAEVIEYCSFPADVRPHVRGLANARLSGPVVGIWCPGDPQLILDANGAVSP